LDRVENVHVPLTRLWTRKLPPLLPLLKLIAGGQNAAATATRRESLIPEFLDLIPFDFP
jgi:hypothetical protein